jgi:hypothetical protein
LSGKGRRALASVTSSSTVTDSSPRLVVTTSPVTPTQSPTDSLVKSSNCGLAASVAKSWTRPVPSSSVPKAMAPWRRTSITRPATDARAPERVSGGRPAWRSWSSPAVAVRS